MRIVIVDESRLRAATVEEGLREAGFTDIASLPPESGFVAELERLAPDVLVFDLGIPGRETFEEMLAVCRTVARPIVMFVDKSDDSMSGAAIDAGVSAYVVDGLRNDRVKPILDLAMRRFNVVSQMQKELREARSALDGRRVIDRAKLLLMSTRRMTEAQSYALLRGSAMRQGRRIADVAQALITAHELLEGKSD